MFWRIMLQSAYRLVCHPVAERTQKDQRWIVNALFRWRFLVLCKPWLRPRIYPTRKEHKKNRLHYLGRNVHNVNQKWRTKIVREGLLFPGSIRLLLIFRQQQFQRTLLECRLCLPADWHSGEWVPIDLVPGKRVLVRENILTFQNRCRHI